DNGQALGINAWRQAVGVSCAGGACRGVLWQGKEVIDLTSHIVGGLNGTITNAGDIDDLGRIAGQYKDATTGATIAFRAIPVAACTETTWERTNDRVAPTVVRRRAAAQAQRPVPPGLGAVRSRVVRGESGAGLPLLPSGRDAPRPRGVPGPVLRSVVADRARGARRRRPPARGRGAGPCPDHVPRRG